jgi:DNA-binding LytR/AlgR family response regulator
MLDLGNKIPDYLLTNKNITRRVLFTAAFALVFINIYSPFGVNTWYEVTRFQLFVYSSGLILTGVLVVAISRFLMYRYSQKKEINYLQYGIWTFLEIVCMAAVYTLLKITVLDEHDDIILEFRKSLLITALVVMLPYVMLTLYFAWQDKSSKLEKLASGEAIAEAQNKKLIPFLDEKGVMRFSLKPADVLYLEAADNYVTIHYTHQDKIARYLIRNSLKRFEEGLSAYNLVRCHRSYMVNFDKVKIIRREKEGLLVELDYPGEIIIPVSKTYGERVMEEFVKTRE